MLFLACWAGHEECHSGPQIDPMHKLCTEAHIVVEHPKAQCTLVTFSGNGTSRDSERRRCESMQKRFCRVSKRETEIVTAVIWRCRRVPRRFAA